MFGLVLNEKGVKVSTFARGRIKAFVATFTIPVFLKRSYRHLDSLNTLVQNIESQSR